MTPSSDPIQAAKTHAADLGAQAKDAARQEAIAQAEHVKETAASQVQQAADAAEAAVDAFDPATPQEQAMQQVAEQVEAVAAHIRQADISELASQATAVARRNPLLFVGGAAVLGFAAARFLKARDPNPQATADPWSSPAAPAPDAGRDYSIYEQARRGETHG